MKEALSYHDVQTILALVDNWPRGHLRYVHGELSVEARLGPPMSHEAATPITVQQVLCPAVGTVELASRKKTGKLSAGQKISAGECVGTVNSLDRVTKILAKSAGTIKAITVKDGQFVQYGQPMIDIDVDDREIED